MDLSTFATDASAEQDGKWFDFGPDAKIKLRSFTSQKSREVRRKLDKPYVGITRAGGTLSDEIQEDLLIKQMSQALIVDWRGFSEKDEELAFSVEAAEALLRKYPRFRNNLAAIIANDASFGKKVTSKDL
jgi:hypothetical protein